MADPTPERAAPTGGLRPLYFYLIVILVFVSDQASKALILRTMSFGEYREIIGQTVMLSLTQNTGGAWGVLPAGNRIFIAFAAVAILALIYAYHRIARNDLLVSSAFALALGGAAGNLLDRVRYQYVVDFFAVRIINYRWPIFNVADSAISLGIVLLLLHYLRSMRTTEAPAPSAAVTGPGLSADDLANDARK